MRSRQATPWAGGADMLCCCVDCMQECAQELARCLAEGGDRKDTPAFFRIQDIISARVRGRPWVLMIVTNLVRSTRGLSWSTLVAPAEACRQGRPLRQRQSALPACALVGPEDIQAAQWQYSVLHKKVAARSIHVVALT